MKRLRLFLAISALAFVSTAATCTKTGPVAPVVAGVISCAEAGVHDAALHILDDVASALATGDYVAALTDLVKRFGEGAVDCAAQEIADKSGVRGQFDPLEATKAANAKKWLSSRPVTLTMKEAPARRMAQASGPGASCEYGVYAVPGGAAGYCHGQGAAMHCWATVEACEESERDYQGKNAALGRGI